MTEDQHRTIQALARCTFLPGSWAKRFVRDLATFPLDKALTERQQQALERVAWQFRKQLKGQGVEIAARPDGAGPDDPTPTAMQQLMDWNEGKPL